MKMKILPTYERPILHRMAISMSFENNFQLKKIYSEIIGENDIDHISINIVNPKQEMSILSFNPAIAYQIISSGVYIYNGSISPDFYTNKIFYSWEESYDPRAKNIIKDVMQNKCGIAEGCVVVKRIDKHYVLFSFATRKNKIRFSELIKNNLDMYSKIGDFMLQRVFAIYNSYCESEDELLQVRPQLKLVTNNED